MAVYGASPRRARFRLLAAMAAGAVAGCVALSACGGSGASGQGSGGSTPGGSPASQAAENNPNLDLGSSLGGKPEPDITLTNQFGQKMSLRQFRGKVVLLGFVDSECTTVCPLTTLAMLQAKQMLGAAGNQVQLLGVDANPEAIAQSDVMAYSRAHGMVNRWDFLTGSLPQLKAAWKAFHIYAEIDKGLVDHTPALFVIDTQGRLQKVYLTQMAYDSIGQSAQVVAQDVAKLLPGHPSVSQSQSLSYISGQTPAEKATLATTTGGQVTVGPGQAHLVVFFATWLTETSDLRSELLGLNSYVQTAKRQHLPPLTVVDEAVTEPSSNAARTYIRGLGQPLDYPVALDTTGRLADGYGVQDQPWYVLTSAKGKIVWSHDGWLSSSGLAAAVTKHAAAG